MARRERDEDITGEIAAVTGRLVEESRQLMAALDEQLAESATASSDRTTSDGGSSQADP